MSKAKEARDNAEQREKLQRDAAKIIQEWHGLDGDDEEEVAKSRYEIPPPVPRDVSKYNPRIGTIEILHGPNRAGDIPHSLASIAKAKQLLGYKPEFSMQQGLEQAVEWYWENIK